MFLYLERSLSLSHTRILSRSRSLSHSRSRSRSRSRSLYRYLSLFLTDFTLIFNLAPVPSVSQTQCLLAKDHYISSLSAHTRGLSANLIWISILSVKHPRYATRTKTRRAAYTAAEIRIVCAHKQDTLKRVVKMWREGSLDLQNSSELLHVADVFAAVLLRAVLVQVC